MKITIDGYFEEYCQGCPELDLDQSILFGSNYPHFKCANKDLCEFLMKRLKERMDDKNETN